MTLLDAEDTVIRLRHSSGRVRVGLTDDRCRYYYGDDLPATPGKYSVVAYRATKKITVRPSGFFVEHFGDMIFVPAAAPIYKYNLGPGETISVSFVLEVPEPDGSHAELASPPSCLSSEHKRFIADSILTTLGKAFSVDPLAMRAMLMNVVPCRVDLGAASLSSHQGSEPLDRSHVTGIGMLNKVLRDLEIPAQLRFANVGRKVSYVLELVWKETLKPA